MKSLMAMIGALALAGCSSTGGFVSPANMTSQERCDNSVLVAVALEGSFGPDAVSVQNGWIAAATTCALGGVEPTVIAPSLLPSVVVRPEPRPF